jgi:aminomethyltransferase
MSVDQALKTPLYDWHQSHAGRLVEFGGWLMPVQYTTIVEEHQAVRQRVGMFDISHMGRLTFDGPDALSWLEHLTTNHVAKLSEYQIQYNLMANGGGGLIDDVLVYRTPFSYVLVCNASNRAHVLSQLERHREGRTARLSDQTTTTAMIAVQGPAARATVQPIFNGDLASVKYYHLTMGRLLGDVDTVISRTGYTGEDGFELMVGGSAAVRVWEALVDSGRPHGLALCGLGARDTLRLEAAMPLYGHELNEAVNPFAAGLGWAVKLDKGDFVGRDALVEFQERPGQIRVGLELEGKRIARQGAEVYHEGEPAGLVTSGSFSPTLQKTIAMAMVAPGASAIGTPLGIDVRGHRENARVVKLPFYKRPHPKSGKSSARTSTPT